MVLTLAPKSPPQGRKKIKEKVNGGKKRREAGRRAVKTTKNLYRKIGTTNMKLRKTYIPEKKFCNDYVTMKGVVDSRSNSLAKSGINIII